MASSDPLGQSATLANRLGTSKWSGNPTTHQIYGAKMSRMLKMADI